MSVDISRFVSPLKIKRKRRRPAVRSVWVDGHWSLRYSDDQPRDDDGRFGSGGGGGETATIKSSGGGGMSPKEVDSKISSLAGIKVEGRGATFPEPKEQNMFTRDAAGVAKEYYVSPDGEHEINGALRQEPNKDASGRIDTHGQEFNGQSIELAREYAAEIEKTMGESKTETVGYRGIVAPPGETFKPGDTFTDKGLVSLSSDKDMAQAFAEGRASGVINMPSRLGDTDPVPVPKVAGTPTVLAIQLPAGSKGTTGERDITETILPRDTTFHVLGTGSDGTVLVRAQEVGLP